MAVRLSKTVGSTPAFWMRLQMNYDLAQIQQRADSIIVNPLPSALPTTTGAGGAGQQSSEPPEPTLNPRANTL